MKYCLPKTVILMTTAIFVTQITAEEVIYGQKGGSVTLPKGSLGGNRASIQWSVLINGQYVNVYSVRSMTVPSYDFSSSDPDVLYTSLESSSPLLLPCHLHSDLNLPSATLKKVGLKSGYWSFAPHPAEGAIPEKAKNFLSLNLQPQLHWESINDSTWEMQIHGNNFSIEREPTEKGGGVYTCALEFENGVTLQKFVQVEVLKIVLSQDTPVLEGQQINLTCTLGHAFPNGLTVKWTIPSRSSLHPLPSGSNLPVLSIPQVRQSDKGWWNCKLMNGKEEKVNTKLNLKIGRVPVDIWLVVSISGAAVAFILLFILPFICVRRHRQQNMFKRRRRKTKYCRCKQSVPLYLTDRLLHS
ncbi:hypothetical protein JZ751_009503 [Albula glossodonta]|uniref:Ig-like domain-containing protein n=1 Tax=Albula glossodonta TaxID=121402 RepID=A0A8T2NVG9_9TELE|nr:hypothetical protein JZ751_009503 [Albula glossodonta]